MFTIRAEGKHPGGFAILRKHQPTNREINEAVPIDSVDSEEWRTGESASGNKPEVDQGVEGNRKNHGVGIRVGTNPRVQEWGVRVGELQWNEGKGGSGVFRHDVAELSALEAQDLSEWEWSGEALLHQHLPGNAAGTGQSEQVRVQDRNVESQCIFQLHREGVCQWVWEWRVLGVQPVLQDRPSWEGRVLVCLAQLYQTQVLCEAYYSLPTC